MRNTLGLLLIGSLLVPAVASAQDYGDWADPPPVLVVQPPSYDSTYTDDPPPPDYRLEDPDSDIDGSAFVGLLVEGVDLTGLELPFETPEIDALRGTTLEPGWAGNNELEAVVTGGLSLGVGMRFMDIVRLELRLHMAGASVDSESAPLSGSPAHGLELGVSSVFALRGELAFGLQLPLGPVTPYVMGIGSVGGAFVDYEVRDARLGNIGTETASAAILGLGVEAGATFDLGDDMPELGLAFRGNFLGRAPSLGGVMTIGFSGE